MKARFCISAEKIPDLKSYALMRWMNLDGSHALIIVNDTVFHCVGEGICSLPLWDLGGFKLFDDSDYVDPKEFIMALNTAVLQRKVNASAGL